MSNTLQTPYFMFHEEALNKDIKLLQDALDANWGNSIVGYSVKTNSLPWLLQHFHKVGFFAEIVSPDEYELSKALGFSGTDMVYNGPIKTKESFLDVALNGGYVNLDSTNDLEIVREYEASNPNKPLEIGIRVNFDLNKECPNATAMKSIGGRFGFSYENGNLGRVIEELKKMQHVKITGLHMHTTSQTRTLKVYETIASMACLISKEYKLSLNYVDMGGGYYGGVKDKPDFTAYMKAICDVLKTTFDPNITKLIVEPGISLISASTTFVSSVLDVKDIREHRYVVTDGSRTNVDPVFNRDWYYHHINYKNKLARKKVEKQIIVGFTCLEHDRIFELTDDNEIAIGDEIVYENVGGYTMSFNPLFIKYFPPIYVTKEDGTVITVREKWTAKEYLQNYYYEGSEEHNEKRN